jgi:hypothetical protein
MEAVKAPLHSLYSGDSKTTGGSPISSFDYRKITWAQISKTIREDDEEESEHMV